MDNSNQTETRKERIHKNLLLTFTIVGILSLTTGFMVNLYTLKRLKS